MRSLLLLIPAVLFAWPQRPEQPPPLAALVNLNVVALDAKGQSVTDLTAAELRVWDNGKPQTLTAFRRRDSRPSASLTLGPRQFSNRSGGTLPHATVILFDQLNMQFADRGYVFNQLSHALQQLESSDNLYLYLITTNGSLYPVHGLPEGDGDAAPTDRPWTKDIQATLTEALKVTLAHRPTDLYVDVDARVRATFATLSVVAARLAAVPGRKNIVWLTHGIPISLSPNRTVSGDWIDYTPYIQQLSSTLDRADVSIYAVQQSPPGSAAASGVDVSTRSGTLGGRGAAAEEPTFTGLGSEQTLDDFASLTGGRAYQNNDIVGAIKQAINDAKQSYLISYAPPPENWDGKFHKIRVTCTRKGIRLQARQGYLAFAEQAASAKQEQDAIDAAMLSSLDAAEIGLRMTVTPLPGDPPVTRLQVRIDVADVQLIPAGGVFTGKLAVRFIVYQDDGTMGQAAPKSLNLHFTPEERDAALKEGFLVTESLSLSPHIQKIRAIVFDDSSTAIGSLTVPMSK